MNIIFSLWIFAFLLFLLVQIALLDARRGTCFFFLVISTVLMFVGILLGRPEVAWAVELPIACCYLWLVILGQRPIEEQPPEVAAQHDRFEEEDRDSLVEFYREGL